MKEKQPGVNWKDTLPFLIILVLVFALVIWAAKYDERHSEITPVKEMTDVDSILNTNDSIKYVIKQKDSIKYDEIFKVRNFDNDSTIKLFEELVRE